MQIKKHSSNIGGGGGGSGGGGCGRRFRHIHNRKAQIDKGDNAGNI